MSPLLPRSKNSDYRAHIQQALEGPLDDLQTRFYVGLVDGRIISQIMARRRPRRRDRGPCLHGSPPTAGRARAL